MSLEKPALQAVEQLTQMTHLPPSMNGSPVLYCFALTAVMCIAALGGYVVSWMTRDAFRDRKLVKINTVVFNFRLMMGLAGLAAFCRSLPEVFYLQMYGDPKVTLTTQAFVMTSKRVADSTSLLFVMGWVSLLVMIYPFIIRALAVEHEQEVIEHLVVDDYPSLQRLRRPVVCFVLILCAAMAFTFGKVYGN